LVFREHAIILFNQPAEAGRRLIVGRQEELLVLRVDSPSQVVLESLQTLDHERLETQQFFRILIDTFAVEFAQASKYLVEVAHVNSLLAKIAAQRLRFAAPLTYFASELPSVFTRPAPRPVSTTPVPSVGSTERALAVAAAVGLTVRLLPLAALTPLPFLTLLTRLTLLPSLTLLTLLPLLSSVALLIAALPSAATGFAHAFVEGLQTAHEIPRAIQRICHLVGAVT
jgi:hypothetical protein